MNELTVVDKAGEWRRMKASCSTPSGLPSRKGFTTWLWTNSSTGTGWSRGHGIRVAVRPLRVDVNQTHLHGSEGILEVAVAGMALVFEPGLLGAPVHILIRFPDIGATTTESEGRQAHRLERDVAG